MVTKAASEALRPFLRDREQSEAAEHCARPASNRWHLLDRSNVFIRATSRERIQIVVGKPYLWMMAK